jgi:peptidoglycan/xylan/chitin deacetylase (PgdA/CDA1 family)
MKSTLRSVAALAYSASPHFLARAAGHVLILAYHRVLPHAERAATFVQPGMYVTPETFERHLGFLSAHFTLLSFEELLSGWQQGSLDPSGRYCVITFDDGWLDNYVHAYPLLRAYRAPATIFLPTDVIGTSEWPWSDRLGQLLQGQGSRVTAGLIHGILAPMSRRYPAIAAVNGKRPEQVIDSLIEAGKQMPDDARTELLGRVAETSGEANVRSRCFMNWNEVREMSSHGIAFGSHTCTHPILTRVSTNTVRHELRSSLQALRRQAINHVPVICYPNGDETAEVAAEARAAGYRAGVTTRAGLESNPPADLLRLRRIGIHEDVSRSVPLLMLHVARRSRASMELTRTRVGVNEMRPA